MRHLFTACTALFLCSSPANAQKLRDQLAQLVTFGSWTSPLQVGTISADGRSIVPSDAFGTAAPNGMLVAFLVSWMGASAAAAPIASTGGGTVFSFAGATPVSGTPSPGPVFGEPATTLGRGAVVAGANYTGVQFSRVRGVPLDDVRLTFTQNPDAGAITDALDVSFDVDYDLSVASLFATAGVLERVDVGVVLPLVRAELRGASTARVIPVAGAATRTVLGGTPDAPVLASSQRIAGRASGVGDVAFRVKANVVDRPRTAFGVLGDVRFPTGDEADLLGSGSLSVRALGLYSGRFGSFSPHVGAGYLHYADEAVNDAFLANVGFNQDVAPWATLTASVIAELQAGESAYQLPATASRPLANIPVIRDDAVSGSLGVKLIAGRARVIANALLPVTRGGPRPDFAYTVGIERDF